MSDDLEALLQRLPAMSRKELIALWTKQIGTSPPCPDNRAMLRSLLATGLQVRIVENNNTVNQGSDEPAGPPAAPSQRAEATPAIGTRSAAPKQSTKSAAKKRDPLAAKATGTKLALLIKLLRRKSGITIEEAAKATGWQSHSVRGVISGMLKKKLGLSVVSDNIGRRGRVYRILG